MAEERYVNRILGKEDPAFEKINETKMSQKEDKLAKEIIKVLKREFKGYEAVTKPRPKYSFGKGGKTIEFYTSDDFSGPVITTKNCIFIGVTWKEEEGYRIYARPDGLSGTKHTKVFSEVKDLIKYIKSVIKD